MRIAGYRFTPEMVDQMVNEKLTDIAHDYLDREAYTTATDAEQTVMWKAALEKARVAWSE
jgi:hypothetical protein